MKNQGIGSNPAGGGTVGGDNLGMSTKKKGDKMKGAPESQLKKEFDQNAP